MDVDVRELEEKLPEYVSRAAAGESIVVTDQGAPVARLVAFDQCASLSRAIEEASIEAPRRSSLGDAITYHTASTVQTVLDGDRGD